MAVRSPARDRLSPRRPARGDRWSRLAAAAVLVALLGWALAPLLYLLHRAAPGDSLTAADGIFPADQLQYLAWVRSAGEHLLAADDFALRRGGHDFVHPMFLISALLWRAGVSLAASYLLWIPVAVLVLFEGYRRYVWRMLSSPGGRIAGLTIALFFVTPLDPLIGWTVGSGQLSSIAGELAPTASLWGYLPMTVSTALLPLYVLELERLTGDGADGSDRRVPRAALRAGLIGGLAAWLHPWQGEVLIVLALAAAGMSRQLRDERWRARVPGLAVAVIAPLLALAYYAILSRADPTWRLAEVQSAPPGPNPLLIVIALAPLLVVALPELARLRRRRPLGAQDRLLIAWPVVSLLVAIISPGYSLHALEGLGLPLTVLAVRGWRGLGWPRWTAAGAIVLVTIPGLAFIAHLLRDAVRSSSAGLLLTRDEQRALAFLDRRPSDGGVLPSLNIAAEIPAYAGQRTWLGHSSWTPSYFTRAAQVGALFGGAMTPADASQLVRSSAARYVVSDCQPHFSASALAPLHPRLAAFGCVLVYTIPGSPSAASL